MCENSGQEEGSGEAAVWRVSVALCDGVAAKLRYVSLGKVESVLKGCPVVANVCVYGDATK